MVKADFNSLHKVWRRSALSTERNSTFSGASWRQNYIMVCPAGCCVLLMADGWMDSFADACARCFAYLQHTTPEFRTKRCTEEHSTSYHLIKSCDGSSYCLVKLPQHRRTLFLTLSVSYLVHYLPRWANTFAELVDRERNGSPPFLPKPSDELAANRPSGI